MPGGQDTDFSARGAAMVAAKAVGRPMPPVAQAPAAAITDPDPHRASTWDALWARHERTRLAISG